MGGEGRWGIEKEGRWSVGGGWVGHRGKESGELKERVGHRGRGGEELEE